MVHKGQTPMSPKWLNRMLCQFFMRVCRQSWCISILTFARKFLLLLPMRATSLCHRYWPEGFCQAARSRGRFGGRSSNPRGEAVPFEACRGPVAQRLEPAAHNGLVAGSSPARPTNKINNLDMVLMLQIL